MKRLTKLHMKTCSPVRSQGIKRIKGPRKDETRSMQRRTWTHGPHDVRRGGKEDEFGSEYEGMQCGSSSMPDVRYVHPLDRSACGEPQRSVLHEGFFKFSPSHGVSRPVDIDGDAGEKGRALLKQYQVKIR